MRGKALVKKIKRKSILVLRDMRYYIVHPVVFFRQRREVRRLRAMRSRGTDPNFRDDISSDTPLDIVIPLLEGELETVVHVIDSVRMFLRHPLGEIFIISPESKKIRDMCAEKKCRFVEENTILPVGKNDIHLVVDGLDRAGWIFQQLLKWGAARIVKNEFYFVPDADTVFIRPQVFENKGRTIISCCASSPHFPYYDAYEKLVGEKALPLHNFTGNHSLIKKSHLAALEKRIEEFSGKPWYRAVIDVGCRDAREVSPISDHEIYDVFISTHFPKEVFMEYQSNLSLKRSEIANVRQLIPRYAASYKTISFHGYK